MLKMEDIKDLSPEDLHKRTQELRDELFKMRLKLNTSGLEKSHQLKATRKDLARVLTFMNAQKTVGK